MQLEELERRYVSYGPTNRLSVPRTCGRDRHDRMGQNAAKGLVYPDVSHRVVSDVIAHHMKNDACVHQTLDCCALRWRHLAGITVEEAVNDALRPLNVEVNDLPLTPERILSAIDNSANRAA